jgi:MFS family permease
VLRIPAVRRFLLTSALANFGHNIVVTVLFKQAYDLTGDELSIAWIGLAQFVPAVLLVLVSGWAADRFDRRRVTALSATGRLACALALAAFSVAATSAVWPLYVIAFAFGAADAMIAPAFRSMMPLLTTTALLPRVVALWTAVFTGAAIVGPIVGGLLITVGPEVAYGVAAASFVASIVPVLLIRYDHQPDPTADRPSMRQAVDGLRFVFRTPIVLGTIGLDLFAVLFGGAIALIPVVATERLGVGDIAYGWLRAAPGIGAAVMAVWLAMRPVRRRIGPTLLVVVGIFGAGTVVFGLTRSYAVAFVALVVISAADMVSMFIRGSLVPLVTPNDQLGRVSAVEGVFIGASNELGAFESGVAARAFGVPLAIAGGGVATMIIAVVFAFAFPAIRRIDTFEELTQPTSDSLSSQSRSAVSSSSR